MKLTIQRSELLRGLGRIQAIVEKRNTMPILANVLLTARGKKDGEGELEFAATDLEIGIRGTHTANVEEEGTLTVSARKFYDITRELPEEPVHLTSQDAASLDIRCGRARFSLAGNEASEYPDLPELEPGKLVCLSAPVVSDMVERTMYAASLDESRYNLNGVFFEVDAESSNIRMVATDGHRLALVERGGGENIEGLASGVIIPRKGLAELKRLVDEDDADEVMIGFDGNSALVRKGDVTLVMRLIEGEFPNYRQVIPKEIPITFNVPTDEVVRALRRVALLSAERSRAIKVSLSSGTLVVSATNPDLGEAQEELDIDYDGEDLEIGFNARYLLDAMNGIGAKETRIGLGGANAPAQLEPAEETTAIAVVMPMRL